MAALPSLDRSDLEIIALLRKDARRSLVDIGSRVNLSAAPVKRRIERLEERGIRAYTTQVDHGKLGPSIDAFTELRIAGNADVDALIDHVRGTPEVREVFTIAGDPDILLRIRVTDLEHLKEVVNGLRRSDLITATKTLMVLDRWAQSEDLPFWSAPLPHAQGVHRGEHRGQRAGRSRDPRLRPVRALIRGYDRYRACPLATGPSERVASLKSPIHGGPARTRRAPYPV